MVTLDELRRKVDELPEFCRTVLDPEIRAFGEKHKTAQLPPGAKQRFLKFGGGAIGLYILAQIVASKSQPSLGQPLGLLFFLGAIVCAWQATKGMGAYVKARAEHFRALNSLVHTFKKRAIAFCDPEFQYTPQATFPAEIYKSCGVFSPSYDVANAEDHVAGVLDKTQFEFQEIRTYRKETSRDSKGRTTTRYIPIFQGILFLADFNKNFKGHTIVQSDVSEKALGIFGRATQRLMGAVSNMKLVELENPEFEHHFKVSSTDPTEARYLLSPKFMEALLALRGKYGQGVQVAFLNSTIVIAIPHSASFMEVGTNLEKMSESLQRFGHELVDMLEIIEDLELNNRIWNKNPQQAGA